MKIKKISFYSADKKENGAMCKCCGAWVKNVCVIDTVEEGRITLGTTCYEKQIKSRLNDMQKKEFNSLVKRIKNLQDRVEEWQMMTEESYKASHTPRVEYKMVKGSYVQVSAWDWELYDEAMSFEEFKQNNVEHFSNRLADNVSKLAKYKVQA